jgi:NADPH-dependent curcumin reductase CurA
MDEIKNWYESRSVWGGVLALAASLTGLFGVEVVGLASDEAVTALTAAAGAVGAAVAIFGRFDARTRIR